MVYYIICNGCFINTAEYVNDIIKYEFIIPRNYDCKIIAKRLTLIINEIFKNNYFIMSQEDYLIVVKDIDFITKMTFSLLLKYFEINFYYVKYDWYDDYLLKIDKHISTKIFNGIFSIKNDETLIIFKKILLKSYSTNNYVNKIFFEDKYLLEYFFEFL